MEKRNYYAAVEGFIEGRYRKVGEPIKMTETQAKYLLLEGQISTTEPKPKPKKTVSTEAKASGSDAKAGD